MLAALAQLAKSESKEEGPVEKASPSSAPGAVDESVLEKAMEEFRAAPDSKAALRSFRALIASVR
jgi:hypothetical protein